MAKKRKNSRQKGKRGEREAVKFLHHLGFSDARRTQQYNGLGKSDVECPDSLPDVHIEVKYGGRDLELGTKVWRDAVDQAHRDSKGDEWCVLWKPSRRAWRLTWQTVDGLCVTSCEEPDIGIALRDLASRADITG